MTRFPFRPRSLTGLILLGFVIVALPALLGTVSAAIEMRNLSAASERLVVNGVAATQYTQALVRQVSSLERTVRLYQIIPRPTLLDTFRQNRDLLGRTLDDFSALTGGNDARSTSSRAPSIRSRPQASRARCANSPRWHAMPGNCPTWQARRRTGS
jgi:CHASE3 domain sensor protein